MKCGFSCSSNPKDFSLYPLYMPPILDNYSSFGKLALGKRIRKHCKKCIFVELTQTFENRVVVTVNNNQINRCNVYSNLVHHLYDT